MSEFTSKLESLMSAEELLFDATPGFGKNYKKFLEQSIAHPAKMNTRLTEFLIRKFTREGDVVLDPMAGSGQTGVIAAVHGRDAVCVELENKFFGWMEQARRKVETQQTLSRKGKIRNVLGDARHLSELLEKTDVVITSPPFSSILPAQDREFVKQNLNKTRKSGKGVMGFGRAMQNDYGSNPQNLGNLRHGKVDVVVTSPPYSEQKQVDNRKRWTDFSQIGGVRHISKEPTDDPKNLGNLKHGKVDSIITSPPYARDKGGEKGMLVHDEKRKNDETLIRTYGENPKNIDNLPLGKVDSIITSPPYADAKKGGEADEDKMAERWDKTAKERNWNTWGKTWKTEGRKRALKSLGSGYSESEENIGNLKKETYLEAMLTVYQQMFSVLKPDGKAIIIIKPFIRNKKVVDLPYQTWLLLKRAGFKLTRLFKLRLKQQSFWRILYSRKFPNVPKISHEYILVTTK